MTAEERKRGEITRQRDLREASTPQGLFSEPVIFTIVIFEIVIAKNFVSANSAVIRPIIIRSVILAQHIYDIHDFYKQVVRRLTTVILKQNTSRLLQRQRLEEISDDLLSPFCSSNHGQDIRYDGGERLRRFVFQQVERGGEGEILGILRWVKPNNDQDHCIAQKSVDSFSFGRRRSLLGVSATSKRRERGSSKPRRRLSR